MLFKNIINGIQLKWLEFIVILTLQKILKSILILMECLKEKLVVYWICNNMSCSILKVNGIDKKSTDLSYDDLVWLYKEFENKNGRLPNTSDGKSKNNLPQQRVTMSILADNHITYNDFMNSLGKTDRVRANIKNYDLYVKRYKEISNVNNHYLTMNDLENNTYGLPSAMWFVDKCPDCSVKTFLDFVKWCGLETDELTKEYVSQKLLNLEKQLKRPIVKSDITLENVGFSSIVICRIWGNFTSCKNDLGLMKTSRNSSKSFEYYRTQLDDILSKIHTDNIGRDFISWKDIESKKYNQHGISHKTFTKSFKSANVDIYKYIKSKGFNMNPSNFSFHHTFDDGERIVSTFEYDFSTYLKNDLELKYGIDYKRDILYKTFSNCKKQTKINCDYVLLHKNKPLYIEIAGIIHNVDNDWEHTKYSSKQEQSYQEKLIKKKMLLEDSNLNYLFLFPEDFTNGDYKNKLLSSIKQLNTY